MGEIAPDAARSASWARTSRALATPARVRRGLSRTFQITQLLEDDTAAGNVALAVQARAGHGFRFWRQRGARRAAARARARGAGPGGAGRGALGGARGRPLARGAQQLELAIALATRAAAAAAGRADGRAGREREPAHDGGAARAEGPHPDAAGGARHGRGVRAGRPDLGARLRPHASPSGSPARRSGTTRRCARPTSPRRRDV